MPVTLYNQSRIKQVGPKKNKPKKKQKNVKSKKSKICKSKKCISKRSKKHKKTVKKIKGGAIFTREDIFTDEDTPFKLFIDDLLKSLKTQWFFNTSPVLENTGKKDTIFEEDTIHDGINPVYDPSSFEDNLWKPKNINDTDPQYIEMTNKFKDDIEVIDRETLLSLDNKYAIFKDYGWGPNLLGLSALLDSASTPSLKKYEAYKEKTSKNCPDDSLCKKEKKCRDCDDALTRSDLPLYAYFKERYKTVFPYLSNDPTHEKKNIILLNFLWYATIAYCAKCSEPEDEKQWCHGIQFLFSMFFTNIEEDGSSYIPTCQFINFKEPKNIIVFNDVSVFTAIKKIRRLFIETEEFGKYFKFKNTDYKNKLRPTEDKREHSFKFKISQSEIAKKIRSVLRKNCPGDYNSNHIVPRGNESTESTKETIYCIQRITEIFYDTYPNTHMDSRILKKNLVYVLRVLKFCGDRSHLILSKINKIAFEENSDSSYKLRPELLYTGERPLGISTIAEEINGVFEILNVHQNYLKNTTPGYGNSEFKKKFLLYLPKKFIYNEIFFEFEQIFNAFKWNLIKNDITNLSGFLTEEYFFGEKKKPICTVEIIDTKKHTNDMETPKEYNIYIIKDYSIRNLNFEIYENDTLLEKNQEKKKTIEIILKPELPYFEKGDSYFNEKIKDFNEKIKDFNNNENFKDFNNEFKIYKRIMDHVYNKEFFKQLNIDFEEDIKSKNTPKIGDLHSSITDRTKGSSWIKYCRETDIGVSRRCSKITGTKLDPNNIYGFFLYKNGSNICSANSYSIFKRVDKLLDFMIYLLDFVEHSENEYKYIEFVIPVNINPDDTSTKIDGLPSLGDVSCPKHKKKIHNILINIRNNYLKLKKNKFEINPLEDTLRKTAKDVYNSLIKELLDNTNNLSKFFNNTILLTKVTKVTKEDSKYFEVSKFDVVSRKRSHDDGHHDEGPLNQKSRVSGAARGGRAVAGVVCGGVAPPFREPKQPPRGVSFFEKRDFSYKKFDSQNRDAGSPKPNWKKSIDVWTLEYNNKELHDTLFNKLQETRPFGEDLIIHTFLKIISLAFKIITNNEFDLNSFSYAIDKLIEDYFYGNTDTFKFDEKVTSAYVNLKILQYGNKPINNNEKQSDVVPQEQDQSDNDYFAVVNLNEDYLLNKNIYEKEISSNYIVDDIESEEFCDYILEVIRPSFEIFEYMYKQNSRKSDKKSI